MLVIVLGVIGGTVSYGLIDLFLGPILLGVLFDPELSNVRPLASQKVNLVPKVPTTMSFRSGSLALSRLYQRSWL